MSIFLISELRKLVVELIDSVSELTTENDLLNNILDIFQDGKISLDTQISYIKNKWSF